MANYRAHCITLGREVSLHRADIVTHTRAIDVDDEGALLVEYPDGRREAVNSGEASVRGMYGYI
jgi:BirA family biotin operon repressor/biotin-[acetyl-CoA-carboxylase] ligase